MKWHQSDKDIPDEALFLYMMEEVIPSMCLVLDKKEVYSENDSGIRSQLVAKYLELDKLKGLIKKGDVCTFACIRYFGKWDE